jgi:uncharacterized protein YjbJ (UPF0337 family)
MKQSTKDRAAGKAHVVKGKIKQKAGEIMDDPDLEAEGLGEQIGGKIREAVGEIEKAESD